MRRAGYRGPGFHEWCSRERDWFAFAGSQTLVGIGKPPQEVQMEREMCLEELEREMAALLPDREEMQTLTVRATLSVVLTVQTSGVPLP